VVVLRKLSILAEGGKGDNPKWSDDMEVSDIPTCDRVESRSEIAWLERERRKTAEGRPKKHAEQRLRHDRDLKNDDGFAIQRANKSNNTHDTENMETTSPVEPDGDLAQTHPQRARHTRRK
jgi:hypothetical protein